MTWTRGMRLRALYLVISLFPRLELSRGVLVNRTIDDQFGDLVTGVLPTYGGNEWEQGASCMECAARPDPSRVFQGSWHDVTWVPGDSSEDMMTVNFDGFAVYVFIILANNLGRTTTSTNLSFSLDGEIVGNYTHSPTSSTDYEYNVTAYANDSLENAQHTLIMQTTGDTPTLVLFDYVVYSVDDETLVTTPRPTSTPSLPLSPSPSISLSPSPPHPPHPSIQHLRHPLPPASTSAGVASGNGKNTKTIVGVSIGGIVIVVVALAICLLLCWCKRRKNRIPVCQTRSNDVVNGTYTNMPSHRDQCGVVPSTAVLSSQDPSSNLAEYAHSTADAKPSEEVGSNHGLESRAHYKSAEKQLHLFRQIEQTVLNAGPRREMGVNSISHGDDGGARALRGRVVDGVELHAQHGSNSNVGSLGVDNEPPPDYSSRGRGLHLSQIG